MNTKTAVKIIVLIIVFLGLYFAVSALGTSERSPEDREDAGNVDEGQRAIPQSITLSKGQSGSAGGVFITLNGVKEDSRCPANAKCIQAGRVVVNVTLAIGDANRNVDMASDGGVENILGHMVSIEQVRPSTSLGQPISEEEYNITFTVSRDDTVGGISWEDAVELIHSGDVQVAAILHSGRVNLILKNGETITSSAPSDTEFFAVIEACGATCADMAIAME
jgi:hypothetical protein